METTDRVRFVPTLHCMAACAYAYAYAHSRAWASDTVGKCDVREGGAVWCDTEGQKRYLGGGRR